MSETACAINTHVFGCQWATKCACGTTRRSVAEKPPELPPKCAHCGKRHA